MMKRSSHSKSGIPISSALKPRNVNTGFTPLSSRSSMAGNNLKKSETKHRGKSASSSKERSSFEKVSRISVASLKITPSKFATPKQCRTTLTQPQYSRSSTDTVRSSFGGKTSLNSWPTSDPAFKTQCIDKILEFLVNNQFGMAINRSVLRSPKKADFVAIFNFIYSHLVPGFALSSRIEDEIPKLLKIMKYPSQLQKSSFLNVGSPHSWPSVLAMLAWLVGNVYIYEEFDGVEDLSNQDFEGDKHTVKKKLKCLISHYKGDDINDKYQVLMGYRNFLEQSSKISDEDFILCEKEIEVLQNKMGNMKLNIKEVELSEQHKAQLCEDRQKLLDFIAEMKSHIMMKNTERQQLETELENLKEHLLEIENEAKRLKEKRECQNYSANEIRNLKKHKDDLSMKLQILDSEKKRLNEQLWECEMKVGRNRTEISKYVCKYNVLCEKIELENYKLPIANPEQDMNILIEEILPSLKEEKKKRIAVTFDSKNNLRNCKAEKEKLTEMFHSTESENHKLACKQKRLLEETNHLKMETTKEAGALQEELENFEELILREKKRPKSFLYEKERLLEEKKKECEEMKEKVEQTKNSTIKSTLKQQLKMKKALVKKAEIVSVFKETAVTHINQHVRECREMIKEAVTDW